MTGKSFSSRGLRVLKRRFHVLLKLPKLVTQPRKSNARINLLLSKCNVHQIFLRQSPRNPFCGFGEIEIQSRNRERRWKCLSIVGGWIREATVKVTQSISNDLKYLLNEMK